MDCTSLAFAIFSFFLLLYDFLSPRCLLSAVAKAPPFRPFRLVSLCIFFHFKFASEFLFGLKDAAARVYCTSLAFAVISFFHHAGERSSPLHFHRTIISPFFNSKSNWQIGFDINYSSFIFHHSSKSSSAITCFISSDTCCTDSSGYMTYALPPEDQL